MIPVRTMARITPRPYTGSVSAAASRASPIGTDPAHVKLQYGAMVRETLTPTSYAVLVLVGRGGAGPHDLVRMMRQGRVYQSAAESQYYAEPKRLERLGYLTASKLPGQTHTRTHYELTSKGIDAL